MPCSSRFNGLVPPGVIVVEMDGNWPAILLPPEEAAAIEGAVEPRRREFATGRLCARLGLTALGVSTSCIPVGQSRAPLWPDGVVGSITHCDAYCAAAVAWRSSVTTIGIDAEKHRPLSSDVFHLVSTAEERQSIATLDGAGVCWDAVLFSVKESIYKAWFPLTSLWLGFEDVAVELHPSTGTFSARLLSSAPRRGYSFSGFVGRFRIDRDHVLTAATVAPRS